jgi:hypothetical protein
VFTHILHATTGIVDQDVQPPKCLRGGGDELGARLGLRHVGQYRQDPGLRMQGPRFGCDRFDFSTLARGGDDHVGTCASQTQRHGTSQPAAGAGHNRHFISQISFFHPGTCVEIKIKGWFAMLID